MARVKKHKTKESIVSREDIKTILSDIMLNSKTSTKDRLDASELLAEILGMIPRKNRDNKEDF